MERFNDEDIRKKEYYRQYRIAHKAEANRYSKAYYKSNKDKISKQSKIRHTNLKSEVYLKLGDKCAYCGFSDKRALHVDHKDGTGARYRKTAHGGSGLYRYILSLNNLDNYQILCANCNWIKGVEEGNLGAGSRKKAS